MTGPRQPGGPPGIVAAAAIVAVILLATGAATLRPPDARIAPDTRLDLNAAPPAQLAALPGIGPKLAHRIAADRTELGPFPTVADLARVDGIGPRTVDRIVPFVIAGEGRR